MPFVTRRTVLAVLAATSALVAMPAYATKDKPLIGFSIDDLRVERWARDRDYFIAAAKELGAEVSVQSADGDSANAHTYWMPATMGEATVLEVDLPAGREASTIR